MQAQMVLTERLPRTHQCPQCAALPDPIDYDRDLCGRCLDEVFEDWAEDAQVYPEDVEFEP
jgi:hypothetical protein